MKRCKQMLMAAVCVCLMVFMLPATANAADSNQSIVYYADGSYSIISVMYDDEQTDISLTAGESTRKGAKQTEYYTSNHDLAWVLTVYGEFTYNGRTAKATDADYSYAIYDPDWSFVRGSASYSGATATATGNFKHITTRTASVSLTCSANGVLS